MPNENCCGRNSNYGLCPKCLRLRELTKHHILPKRVFAPGKHSPLLHLCRECHDTIDYLTLEWDDKNREYIIYETVLWLTGEKYEMRVLQERSVTNGRTYSFT